MNEKVYFKNSKGDKLVGILSNPTLNKDKPIIILCHGRGSNKDGHTFLGLEELLNKNEISIFRFDFYGHGESEGKFEDITISEAVDDILNAISFLKQLGYKKIGLMGSSFGGIASIVAASKTDDLFVLALKCPVSDYKEIGRNIKLNRPLLKDAKIVDGYEAAKKIKIPTLIVHGDADERVPLEQSRKTTGIIKDCKLEIIKGADHAFSNPEDFDKVLNLISEFIVEHLK